jgi:hypothetical protein
MAPGAISPPFAFFDRVTCRETGTNYVNNVVVHRFLGNRTAGAGCFTFFKDVIVNL